jgi:predicted transposase YbfD/YdcC
VHKNQCRIEIRRCWAIADPLAFEDIRHYQGWANLHTSLPIHAESLLACTRHHWSIENAFHWVLDVTFSEDDSRVRSRSAPENFVVLRHLALNFLKQDPARIVSSKNAFAPPSTTNSCFSSSLRFDAITHFTGSQFWNRASI